MEGEKVILKIPKTSILITGGIHFSEWGNLYYHIKIKGTVEANKEKAGLFNPEYSVWARFAPQE